MFEVKILNSEKELESVEKIYVKHALWGTKDMPETYGQIGYVLQEGFYVKMVCHESNPTRVYTKHQDPVWQDSAVELYMQLPDTNGMYMNFEINANGAVLTEYGVDRSPRVRLSKDDIARLHCVAEIEENFWSVRFCIPQSWLEMVYGNVDLHKGMIFKFNLYKVCENDHMAQFGSCTVIPLGKPDFHRPEYFAEAVLV